jgi:hypothetical protein
MEGRLQRALLVLWPMEEILNMEHQEEVLLL